MNRSTKTNISDFIPNGNSLSLSCLHFHSIINQIYQNMKRDRDALTLV